MCLFAFSILQILIFVVDLALFVAFVVKDIAYTD